MGHDTLIRQILIDEDVVRALMRGAFEDGKLVEPRENGSSEPFWQRGS